MKEKSYEPDAQDELISTRLEDTRNELVENTERYHLTGIGYRAAQSASLAVAGSALVNFALNRDTLRESLAILAFGALTYIPTKILEARKISKERKRFTQQIDSTILELADAILESNPTPQISDRE